MGSSQHRMTQNSQKQAFAATDVTVTKYRVTLRNFISVFVLADKSIENLCQCSDPISAGSTPQLTRCPRVPVHYRTCHERRSSYGTGIASKDNEWCRVSAPAFVNPSRRS